jgi:hypothetical protein
MKKEEMNKNTSKVIVLAILAGLWLTLVPLSKALMQSEPLAPESVLVSEEICANTTVPAGWIVVDKTAQSFRCGVQMQPTIGGLIYNVWTIEKISDKFVGERVLACDSPTPPTDWIVIERGAVSFRCGVQMQPTIGGQIINVMVIERVNGPVRTPTPPVTPTPRSPIGYLDSIDQATRTARGWTLDPDNPQASNVVHFYIDGPAGNTQGSGTFVGQVTANMPRPDVNQSTGYPGNHGYTFSIPSQYHDCQPHTIYAYGLDTGSAPPTHLTGSPKSFTFCTPQPSTRTAFDFNNDGRADQTVFRGGNWYSNLSPNNGFLGIQFGQPGDVPVPADYDGDGKTDHAVVRRTNGYAYWYILQSSTSTWLGVQFGIAVDKPVPADYDGDFKADIAVFRPDNGVGHWYILNSSTNQFSGFQYGAATDKPVPADYDGDGKADAAVTRAANGLLHWYIQRSALGFTGFQFGVDIDKPTPADYDGDGKADPGVYRNGNWYLLRSRDGFIGYNFGQSGDTPVPADYDGDRRTDVAFFRTDGTYGYWHILQSSNNQSYSFQYGLATDIPVNGNPQQ